MQSTTKRMTTVKVIVIANKNGRMRQRRRCSRSMWSKEVCRLPTSGMGNMRYVTYSYRQGLELFEATEHYAALWREVDDAITSVSDDDIAEWFTVHCRSAKSLSYALNALLKERLIARGWREESPIFGEGEYMTSVWRLDFAKQDISVEVGFNHGEAVAWNLIKPVIASELNHVQKAIQTTAGIIITATQELKDAGGFDSAVGTYEKYVSYLKPLRSLLTVPMVVVGLRRPEKFHIEVVREGNRCIGEIVAD